MRSSASRKLQRSPDANFQALASPSPQFALHHVQSCTNADECSALGRHSNGSQIGRILSLLVDLGKLFQCGETLEQFESMSLVVVLQFLRWHLRDPGYINMQVPAALSAR